MTQRVAWYEHYRTETRFARRCKCKWVEFFVITEGDFVDEDWHCGQCWVRVK